MSTSPYYSRRQINPCAPLGSKDVNLIHSSSSPRSIYFLTVKIEDGNTMEKESLFNKIGSLFICSRIIITEEELESYTVYHILFELSSPLQWKNVDASFMNEFAVCNVIPLKAFSRGLKYILSVDQSPYYWNFSSDKAIRREAN